MVVLRFDNRKSDFEFQNNKTPTTSGPQIALLGNALVAIGVAIQVYGEAVAIQEEETANKAQEKKFELIQKQLDEIQKAQSSNHLNNIDIENFNHLLELLARQLDSSKKRS